MGHVIARIEGDSYFRDFLVHRNNAKPWEVKTAETIAYVLGRPLPLTNIFQKSLTAQEKETLGKDINRETAILTAIRHAWATAIATGLLAATCGIFHLVENGMPH